jgi:hypothetical protein
MIEPPSITREYVTADVAGTNLIAEGSWAPPAPDSPSNANIWVVALPGRGVGYSWDNTDRLPMAIGWPTTRTPTTGDVISSGQQGGVSWSEVWSDQGCPKLNVVAAVSEGDLGSSPCPIPWNPQEYANRTSYVGGVYGRNHATVWILGPNGMLASVASKDDPKASLNCGGSVANVGGWAQTGQCVLVIPVGQTYVFQPTLQDGTPLEQTITITAQPGRIKVSEAGGSPSPTP